MLITKTKLDKLMEVMTTDKARRAVRLWAIDQGEATIDTLIALDGVSDKSLAILAKLVNEEVQKRGI
jgi:hypothetical protein